MQAQGKAAAHDPVDGKQGVYAVYAEDDLAGVVSGISQRSGRKCCGRCGKSAEYLHIIETFLRRREAAKRLV